MNKEGETKATWEKVKGWKEEQGRKEWARGREDEQERGQSESEKKR